MATTQVSQAPGMPGQNQKGTALPNLFINIAGQTKSTLSGKDVDPKLKTTDQLLSYNERLERDVNPSSINNLFAAGELMAGHVKFRILRTDVIPYLEQMMAAGKNIPKIVIYRAEIINGKLTVTDEYIYQNCYITEYDSYIGEHTTQDPFDNLDSAIFQFRFLKRTHNVSVFSQLGAPQGKKNSVIDFQKGVLGA